MSYFDDLDAAELAEPCGYPHGVCYDCRTAPAVLARVYKGQAPITALARCEPCDSAHVRALAFASSNPDPGRRVRL